MEIQKELDNTLNDLKNFINNIDNIDNINEFNTTYTKIKNYENNIIKINKTVQKIILVKDSLNIVLNNYLFFLSSIKSTIALVFNVICLIDSSNALLVQAII